MAVECRQPVAYRDELHKIGAWFFAENRDSFSFSSRLLLLKRAGRLFPLLPSMNEPHSHLGSTSHEDFRTMSVCSFLTGIEAKRSYGTG